MRYLYEMAKLLLSVQFDLVVDRRCLVGLLRMGEYSASRLGKNEVEGKCGEYRLRGVLPFMVVFHILS